ncbi:unnamed protein product [Mycena citricolor]|uniref:Ubiquitin-like protease family profile domain-containing protein n=1 Tax=Mycena citricolor TaxID=2018698 RepID=A0AAD2JZ13_9AGAR|nr:unnamed protein product [Mycena citricolor]CAK5274339.1 unnamed protein product [Mycena citricolor]
MAPRKRAAAQLPFGVPSTSPMKRKAAREVVDIHPHKRTQAAHLQARLNALLARKPLPSIPSPSQTLEEDNPYFSEPLEPPQTLPDHSGDPSQHSEDASVQPLVSNGNLDEPMPAVNERAVRAADNWETLLPKLESVFLDFHRAYHGAVRPTIASSLDASGADPSVPMQMPARAALGEWGVSLDVLDSYRAYFERSADAITALAASLATVYRRRGFELGFDSTAVEHIDDPFRNVLSHAVLYSSLVRSRLEKRLEVCLRATEDVIAVEEKVAAERRAELENAEMPLAAELDAEFGGVESAPSGGAEQAPALDAGHVSEDPSALTHLTKGRADRVLRERCPACFALEEWGRSLSEGGDVQLGGDGCFSLRHLRSSGDGPIPFSPAYFLSDAEMKTTRARITAARAKPPRKFKPAIPQAALDSCQSSFDAANESKQKADPKHFDSTGAFVLTCRHSQVLFLANMDTPGEQQCYLVALLDKVASLLPPVATILQAYDIGCQMDHSCHLYPLLSPTLRERIAFVINIMHSFGHEWDCQLVYSPRFFVGMGLSDMEGVERFWSRVRKLINLTRQQWQSRRIWMLDEYTAFVNQEGAEKLGDWLDRQQANLLPKYRQSIKTLHACRVSERELRSQWRAQKAAQSSRNIKASARFRKDLDKVITLQNQIVSVETAILDVKKSIGTSGASVETLCHLDEMEDTHMELSDRADALYASLNLRHTFPQLSGLPANFVKLLLTMHDLKVNIRKRAVGSFYEMETLDRAVGGKKESLGTKFHQQTRKAMAKRHPILYRLIERFNSLCEKAEEEFPAGCHLPVPHPLPTRLASLRNDLTLYEDVCVTPSSGAIPRWLDDSDVRDGIQNMHSVDRCTEEMPRLNRERANLELYLLAETALVSRCIHEAAGDPLLQHLLQLRATDLERLAKRWRKSFGQYTLSPFSGGTIFMSGFSSAAASASKHSTQTNISRPNLGAENHRPLSTPEIVPVPQSSSHLNNPADAIISSARSPSPDLDASAGNIDGSASAHLHLASADIPLVEEIPEENLDDDIEILEMQDTLQNVDLDDDEDTSAFAQSDVNVAIHWECPEITYESTMFIELEHRNNNLNKYRGDVPHVVVRGHELKKLTILAEDLARFINPTGLLSGHGINGVAASMLAMFGQEHSPYNVHARRCALLSTYELPRIRSEARDKFMWAELSPLCYWEKDFWILPIHRASQQHWVVAVASIPDQKIFFFDSLSGRSRFRKELQEFVLLISRMTALANRHGKRLNISENDWHAYSLFTPGKPKQTNGYDCGVWILAVMGAFMRGHHLPALAEPDLQRARHIFAEHIQTLSMI